VLKTISEARIFVIFEYKISKKIKFVLNIPCDVIMLLVCLKLRYGKVKACDKIVTENQ